MTEIQAMVLNVFKMFAKICEDNGLSYYLGGGALIGTLRNKGFIPWDDDIDVTMPRADFDKFNKLIMPNGYGLCNRFTNSDWDFDFSQFMDLSTEVKVHLANIPRYTHICIDVFPIDGLPNNRILRWLHVKNIMLLRYFIQALNVSKQVDIYRQRPWYEKVIINFCKNLSMDKICDTKKILNKLECILKKYSDKESKYCGNMLGRYRYREVVETRWFGIPKTGIFEKTKVPIPENAHEILSAVYGDYMELPPIGKRYSHNIIVIKSNIKNVKETES